MTKAIRGAVQFAQDDKELISERICCLLEKMISSNEITEERIVSIFFSITEDLRSINPAAALRTGGGFSTVPLFCAQEPYSEGAMERVVRVLLTFETDLVKNDLKHVYLDGAEKLRPDFAG